MLKNYRKSLLLVGALLVASHNMGYAANGDFDSEQRTASSKPTQTSLCEEDFDNLNCASNPQVSYGLNPLKDGLTTGFAVARLTANLSAIYLNTQLAWGNLTALNVPGLIGNLKVIKSAGTEVIETIKQVPAALNKAVLHKARIAYHIEAAKDSKFVKTVSGWFGW